MCGLKFALIIQFLFISTSFAQVADQLDDIVEQIVPKGQVSNQQMKALRQKLKIQKTIIEGVKSIEMRGGEFVNLEKATSTIERLVVNSFGAEANALPKAIKDSVQKTVKDSVRKSAIQRMLVRLKSLIYGQVTDKKILLSSTARRFGFDVGLVYAITFQIDFTFPSIMVAMGHVEYLPLLFTPVSSTATASYTAIKSGVRMNQMIQNLGGLSAFAEKLETIKKIKNFFNTGLLPQHDIIDLEVAGRNYALTVERQGTLTKFKQMLGYNDRLNYKNLLALMEDHNFAPGFVDVVRRSERPAEVKFIRLLHRIELENNPEFMEVMKVRFGKYVNDINGIPDFSRVRSWTAKISNARSFQHFNKLMMEMPDEIPPSIFDKLWRKHILPGAAKNIGPYMDKSTYQAFRQMDNLYQNQLRGQMANSIDQTLDNGWKSKIADYFFKATTTVNGCEAIFYKRGDFAPLL